ncbi:type IX secretion system periplasmic lipoprotein PorW/SprE [Psychroflexus montanilacus]
MRIKFLLLSILGLVLILSCSRKKDKFLNKNFHAMTTYYNIVYNGNLELEKGKEQVESSYVEDYWSVLPVERMAIQKSKPKRNAKNSKKNPEASDNSPFQMAEEKATKSIQKHSMFMGGREFNPQIDEAFLLLGKARYYDQRFVPAKDAFNFILNHYPESSTINEAKIWVEKTNLRLEYFDMAIGNLVTLINTSELTPLEQYEASATLAQAYIFEDQKRLAIPPLRTAIETAPDDEKKGRLLYIKAQLHSLLEEKDSAIASFDEVIKLNRNSPRRYMIHSELEKLRLRGYDEALWYETEMAFQELAENRENRPYLDFIHYDNAVFRLAKDSVDLAIEKFNKSLREQPRDKYLKSRNYLNLGEIYFDKASYETSGKYYDSTLTNLAKKGLEYRQVKRKRDNLDDVIKFERIAKENDSILNLVNAPEEKRIQIFETYIEKLKEEEKSVFAKKGTSQPGNSRFGAQKSRIGGGQANSSKFYFYDITQKQRGEESFRKTWGNIELADDWRRSPSRNSGISDEEAVVEESVRPEFDPQTYIAQIPTDESVIDSISDQRNFAYYQLGIIYKEKFKKYELAITKLTDLLENDPEERLIIPSKYYLYKIYDETGDENLADKWKNEILNQHPDSRYASILRNPDAYRNAANNPKNVYNRLYNDYKSGNYQYVLNEIETYTKVFVGNSILPKLELLKARVLAKLEGAVAYTEALNYVALTYPQSQEGKYAQEQYNKLKRKPFSSQFDMKPDPNAEYILVYDLYKEADEAKIEEIKANLTTAIQNEEGLDLSLNEDVYNQNQTFVTINGLKSKLGAEGLAEKFIENAIIDKSFTYFVITQKNYKVAQINKNLDEYLEKTN